MTSTRFLFASSHLLGRVILGYRLKRLLWLPRHIWVDRTVGVNKAFDQAVAGHVQIIFGIVVGRQGWCDKGEHESAINADTIEDTQNIDELTGLHPFVAHIVATQLQGILGINNGPPPAACILGTLIGTTAKLADDDGFVMGEVPLDDSAKCIFDTRFSLQIHTYEVKQAPIDHFKRD